MPTGATWTGVYFSQLYGYLHIVQTGKKIQGKWIRPQKDRWGELKGEVTGDLMKFSWTEHMIRAPKSRKTGKGYLKYTRPAGDDVDDAVIGEIGRENDEVGEPWDAIKQRNIDPDLSSIGGNSGGGGSDWD